MAIASAPTLQFLGAAGGVTGSKFLFSNNSDQFLIDCGLFQGLKELRLRNWAPLPIDLARLRVLFERYGTYAREVAAFIAAGEDHMLSHSRDYSQREVMFIAQQEQVQHLDDFVLRRSLLAMLGRLTRDSLQELASVIGMALDWSDETQAAEIAHTLEILKSKHRTEL